MKPSLFKWATRALIESDREIQRLARVNRKLKNELAEYRKKEGDTNAVGFQVRTDEE